MASIIKRGAYQYQALVRRKGYPNQTKTFESRADAVRWVRDIESRMDDGKFRDLRPLRGTTLGELLQRYLEQVTVKKRSVQQETNRIRQLQRHPLAQRSMDSLQTRDFTHYRDEREKQVSSTSVRLELAILSHLYTMAIKEWSLPLNHELKNIRKPQPNEPRERRLLGNEFGRLIAAIHRPEARSTSVWLDACVRLAIETGMRAGELLSTEWHQVDLPGCHIRLEKTKNGNKRIVPLTEAAIAILESLPRPGVRVIPNFHDTGGLDHAFKNACDAAGIVDLRFHDLRHESASRYAPHMKPQSLAKIMGWKTLQMAMRYYNPKIEELVSLVRQSTSANTERMVA